VARVSNDADGVSSTCFHPSRDLDQVHLHIRYQHII